jgi:uncharacterized membrane protein
VELGANVAVGTRVELDVMGVGASLAVGVGVGVALIAAQAERNRATSKNPRPMRNFFIDELSNDLDCNIIDIPKNANSPEQATYATNKYNSAMIKSTALKGLLVLATLALVTVWLIKTPPGLLGKADAVAYAVCHRAPLRSFTLGDRPLPLCARCSGTFLGGLMALIYVMRLGRRGELPDLKTSLMLGTFAVAFGLDGLNSFARLVPGAPSVYQSQNWLRLLTGTGVGLGIGALLSPVFSQVVWIDFNGQHSLGNWREIGILLGLAGLLDLAILSNNPLILYPLAVLSGLSVLAILTVVYTVIWVLLSKQENRYHNLRELWVPITAGFLTALLQISFMDAGRLILTGTWAGINLPN